LPGSGHEQKITAARQPMTAPQLELFRDDYRIRERPSARARQIRIEVRSAHEVVLVYPRWAARADALAFLRARDAWVRDKLAGFAARDATLPPPARWDGSDELLLYGRTVPVCVEPATLRQLQVRIEADLISVFAPPAVCRDAARLERALRRALMQRAERDARRLLDAEAARLGVRWSGPSIRDPSAQWGSCGPDGAIALSWRLVMAPPEVFRYVVIHELCHRVHMDHSPRFWALVAQQMPEFETHKTWLRDQGARLQHYLPTRRRG
jgi:predicted metal-dependent hydrolase